MDENTVNLRAEQLLDEAAFTSSLVKNKERERGSVDPDHIYPITKGETDRMADLLRQAEAAVEDASDVTYREKYDQLNEVVQWSYGRYRTWTWGVLLGVVLLALLLLWGRNSNKKDADMYKAYAAQAEAWTPCDTTITWDACEANGSYSFENEYASANKWKRGELQRCKSMYVVALKNIEDYQQKVDTATNKEAKERYLESIKRNQKDAENARQRFDSVAKLDFKGIQNMAKEKAQDWSKYSSEDSGSYLGWMIFFVVLAALYIWTGYAYGYEVTRHKTRDKVLGWIGKIGFWLAGVFFGSGLLMQLFAPDKRVEYIFSSGRRETHTESDVAGTSMNIMLKVVLMVIGAAIFIGISVFLMFFAVIGGIIDRIRRAGDGKAVKSVTEQ
ncbi:MAG: hypothetical protein IJ524_05650 [Bacteroidales bacterium]|nr:hypothetical protein [Bacteroidales bacterium]